MSQFAEAEVKKETQSGPLQELTHQVARMASLLETLSESLQSRLQNTAASHHRDIAPASTLGDLLRVSPIYDLLNDDAISDILINGPFEIYVAKADRLEKTNATFRDAGSLQMLANAIAGSVGRPLDPKRPMVDARLKDGSRVNIIAPPMAVDGLIISIRKFPQQEITVETMVQNRVMTPQIAEFLKFCVQARASILISGGTGTGKTTLLNAISRFIPETERIITIEDTAELRLQQPHVVRLETKWPYSMDNRREEVNASDLLRNALRMRPDRIIVGEVRGEEAYDMVQALNTGHAGSLTTVHAGMPRAALTRIENLTALRMPNTPAASIRRQIVSALNIIVELVYDVNGRRRVSSIAELVGMEKDTATMQEIFTLKNGMQVWSGIVPHHAKLAAAMRANAHFRQPLRAMERVLA